MSGRACSEGKEPGQASSIQLNCSDISEQTQSRSDLALGHTLCVLCKPQSCCTHSVLDVGDNGTMSPTEDPEFPRTSELHTSLE